MAEDGLNTMSQACNKSLLFTVSLYFVYRDEWLDPGMWIPRVWTLDPKLQFQFWVDLDHLLSARPSARNPPVPHDLPY
jgi:hypothetical protein